MDYFSVARLGGDVEALVSSVQDEPLVLGRLPVHTALHFKDVQLDLGQAGRVARGERVELLAQHLVLAGAEVEDAHVVTARLLGLADDGHQRVGEVLEQSVLQVDRHAEDSVEELGDVVVVFVQRQDARISLAVADQANANQRSGYVCSDQ